MVPEGDNLQKSTASRSKSATKRPFFTLERRPDALNGVFESLNRRELTLNALNCLIWVLSNRTILTLSCPHPLRLSSTSWARRSMPQDYERLQHGTLHGIEAKPLPYLLCEMNLLLHGMEYPEIDPGNALPFPLREIGDKDRVDVIMTNPPFGGEEERGILSNFPEDRHTAETALLSFN